MTLCGVKVLRPGGLSTINSMYDRTQHARFELRVLNFGIFGPLGAIAGPKALLLTAARMNYLRLWRAAPQKMLETFVEGHPAHFSACAL